MKYTEYFGMKTDPFVNNLETKNLLKLPGTLSVKERLDYLLKTGGVMVVTGDVGIGKSTALRWSLSQYHPSELHKVYVTANSGSTNELYKQLCWGLDIDVHTGSRSLLMKKFKEGVKEIVEDQKIKLVITIDEASLLRPDIFAELHTLTQFNYDSTNLFSLVLVGQNSLLDKLKYRTSAPLASRVITRAHIQSINADQMRDYIKHHLKIVGIKKGLFDENAITAIFQGSGGLLRKANSLARGSLLGCMIDSDDQVNEEHVRRASTELI
ncbi:MAG: AAA family ATPase [Deltaproteobacteria bacterium]|nr:AAA family ATPase [Deltaproteobacteria bacterium]